ncbi:MAG: lamin tail domain-containing protein [Bacteroidales bacterium]|nr:lamin tail domain-containing protein [Bacteroidales bacterium]MDT8432388.1 lamin tail domain-containing protein [Bacteroidales bacterium]
MKRKLLIFTVGTFISLSAFAQQNASDLFISEYCEWNHKLASPENFNHYVELYNGTGEEVDMTKYQLWRAKNGEGWGMDGTIEVGPFQLDGALANGETFVIARPVEDNSEVTADMRWSFMNISGDDAIGLAKDDGTGVFVLIDVIGEPNNDPGSNWPVGDSTNGTQNHTLIRKSDICSPTTDWPASAGTSYSNSQWIVKAENDTADVGMHTTECTGTVNVFVHELSGDLVYPVPNDGNFIYETKEEMKVHVIDATGRNVSYFRVVPGVNNISLDLPQGIYFISNTERSTAKRMIIR